MVISQGRIVATGTPANIGGRETALARNRFAPPVGAALDDLPVPALGGDDALLTVETREPTRVLHLLTGWALQRGVVLDRLAVDRPSLEEVYLQLTDPSPAGAGDDVAVLTRSTG